MKHLREQHLRDERKEERRRKREKKEAERLRRKKKELVEADLRQHLSEKTKQKREKKKQRQMNRPAGEPRVLPLSGLPIRPFDPDPRIFQEERLKKATRKLQKVIKKQVSFKQEEEEEEEGSTSAAATLDRNMYHFSTRGFNVVIVLKMFARPNNDLGSGTHVDRNKKKKKISVFRANFLCSDLCEVKAYINTHINQLRGICPDNCEMSIKVRPMLD